MVNEAAPQEAKIKNRHYKRQIPGEERLSRAGPGGGLGTGFPPHSYSRFGKRSLQHEGEGEGGFAWEREGELRQRPEQAKLNSRD